MDTTNEEEPRFYSQATAHAMRVKIDEQRDAIRQLDNIIGVLNREAEQQAETITELREQVELWRSRYLRAVGRHRTTIDNY